MVDTKTKVTLVGETAQFVANMTKANKAILQMGKKLSGLTTRFSKISKEFEEAAQKINKASGAFNKAGTSAGRAASGVSKAGKAAAKARRKWTKFGTSVASAGAAMKSTGHSMLRASAVATAGIAGMIAISARFEKSMMHVALVSRGSLSGVGKDFDMLSKKATALARTTEHTATEISKGMKFMAMAGFDTDAIVNSIDTIAKVATAGNMSMAQSGNVVTNIMAGYGITISNVRKEVNELTNSIASADKVNASFNRKMEDTANMIVGTYTNANVDLMQMGEAFKLAGSNAALLGMEMEELFAMIGLLGNVGIQGTEAGTALKRSFFAMMKTTEKSRAAMEGFGVSAKGLKDLGALDLLGKLEGSQGAYKEAGKDIEFLTGVVEIFGERAGPKMAALLAQGSDELIRLRNEIQSAKWTGLADQIETGLLDTLIGKLNILKSQFESLIIAIGEAGLNKAIEDIVDSLQDMMDGMEDNAEAFADIVETAGWFALGSAIAGVGLVVAGMIGSVGILLTSLSTAIFSYRNLIALQTMSAGLGVGGAGAGAFGFAAGGFLSGIGTKISGLFSSIANGISAGFTGLVSGVKVLAAGISTLTIGVAGAATAALGAGYALNDDFANGVDRATFALLELAEAGEKDEKQPKKIAKASDAAKKLWDTMGTAGPAVDKFREKLTEAGMTARGGIHLGGLSKVSTEAGAIIDEFLNTLKDFAPAADFQKLTPDDRSALEKRRIDLARNISYEEIRGRELELKSLREALTKGKAAMASEGRLRKKISGNVKDSLSGIARGLSGEPLKRFKNTINSILEDNKIEPVTGDLQENLRKVSEIISDGSRNLSRATKDRIRAMLSLQLANAEEVEIRLNHVRKLKAQLDAAAKLAAEKKDQKGEAAAKSLEEWLSSNETDLFFSSLKEFNPAMTETIDVLRQMTDGMREMVKVLTDPNLSQRELVKQAVRINDVVVQRQEQVGSEVGVAAARDSFAARLTPAEGKIALEDGISDVTLQFRDLSAAISPFLLSIYGGTQFGHAMAMKELDLRTLTTPGVDPTGILRDSAEAAFEEEYLRLLSEQISELTPEVTELAERISDINSGFADPNNPGEQAAIKDEADNKLIKTQRDTLSAMKKGLGEAKSHVDELKKMGIKGQVLDDAEAKIVTIEAQVVELEADVVETEKSKRKSLEREGRGIIEDFQEMGASAKEVSATFNAMTPEMKAFIESLGGFKNQYRDPNAEIDPIGDMFDGFDDDLSGYLGDLFGGGKAGKKTGDATINKAEEIFGGMFSSFTSGFGGQLGSMIGSWVGSAFAAYGGNIWGPIVGGIVGAAVEGIGGVLVSAFGKVGSMIVDAGESVLSAIKSFGENVKSGLMALGDYFPEERAGSAFTTSVEQLTPGGGVFNVGASIAAALAVATVAVLALVPALAAMTAAMALSAVITLHFLPELALFALITAMTTGALVILGTAVAVVTGIFGLLDIAILAAIAVIMDLVAKVVSMHVLLQAAMNPSTYILLSAAIMAATMAIHTLGAAITAGLPVVIAAGIGLILAGIAAALTAGLAGVLTFFTALAFKDVEGPYVDEEGNVQEEFKSKRGDVMSAFSGALDPLIIALDSLWAGVMPLAGLFSALVNVILPLAQGFSNVGGLSRTVFYALKNLAIIFATSMLAVGYFATGVLEVIAWLLENVPTQVNTFMDEFGKALLGGLAWILRGLADFASALQLDEAAIITVANELDGFSLGSAGDTLQDLADAARDLKPDLGAMALAIQELMNLTYEEALAIAEEIAARKNMDLSEFGEQLTNVPEGFRVNLARYLSMDDENPGTAVAGVSRKKLADMDPNDYFNRLGSEWSGAYGSGDPVIGQLKEDIERLTEVMNPNDWADIFGDVLNGSLDRTLQGFEEVFSRAADFVMSTLVDPGEAFERGENNLLGGMGNNFAAEGKGSVTNVYINDMNINDISSPTDFGNEVARRVERDSMQQLGTPFNSDTRRGGQWGGGD